MVLIALIPKWIHKLIFATFEQLPVYRYDNPSLSSWFMTAHMVNEIFNRQTITAVAAQAITPTFQPDIWFRRRSTLSLIDRTDGSLNDVLCMEDSPASRSGAEEMYDPRLYLWSVSLTNVSMNYFLLVHLITSPIWKILTQVWITKLWLCSAMIRCVFGVRWVCIQAKVAISTRDGSPWLILSPCHWKLWLIRGEIAKSSPISLRQKLLIVLEPMRGVRAKYSGEDKSDNTVAAG